MLSVSIINYILGHDAANHEANLGPVNWGVASSKNIKKNQSLGFAFSISDFNGLKSKLSNQFSRNT